jgi:hypothetical protein
MICAAPATLAVFGQLQKLMDVIRRLLSSAAAVVVMVYCWQFKHLMSRGTRCMTVFDWVHANNLSKAGLLL